MEIKNEWEIVTHLLHIGLNNHDTEWGIDFCVYTDEKRETLQGCPIGFLINGKFVQHDVQKDYKYKMIWTKDGNIIMLRRKTKSD